MRTGHYVPLILGEADGGARAAKLEHLRGRINELEGTVSTDHLTGAWNRAHLDRVIEAELARIGLYYANESILAFDPATGLYGAAATPSMGNETLSDFYADLVSGVAASERGDHAVF